MWVPREPTVGMNKLIVTGLGSTSCWQLRVAVSLLWLHFIDLSAWCLLPSCPLKSSQMPKRGWCPIGSGHLSTGSLRCHFPAVALCSEMVGNRSFILESSSRKIPQHRAGEGDNLGDPALSAAMLNKEPHSSGNWLGCGLGVQHVTCEFNGPSALT